MTSVGIDASKGKSTVCILKTYGEVIVEPYEVQHTEPELRVLVYRIKSIEREVWTTVNKKDTKLETI